METQTWYVWNMGRIFWSVLIAAIATFLVAGSGQAAILYSHGSLVESLVTFVVLTVLPMFLIRYGIGEECGAVCVFWISVVNTAFHFMVVFVFATAQIGMSLGHGIGRNDYQTANEILAERLPIVWTQPWWFYVIIFLFLMFCSRRYWLEEV